LLAPFPPPPTSTQESPMINVHALPLQGEGGWIDWLSTIVDPRKPRGVRHPVVTMVGIAVCAALSGGRSFCALGEGAQGLTREALERLGAKRWTPPSEPTIRRVLPGLDAHRRDAPSGQWVARQQLRPGVAVAVDGQSLRRSHEAGERAPHLLSAILHQEAVGVGQMDGEEKTNEIPKLPELLAPLPLQGTVVTADALHTQKETARYRGEEKKADYLFIAQDNQPTLRQDIADLQMESIPPSAHNH
jgi:hypothetical protein